MRDPVLRRENPCRRAECGVESDPEAHPTEEASETPPEPSAAPSFGRRQFLGATLASLAAALWPAPSAGTASAQRPIPATPVPVQPVQPGAAATATPTATPMPAEPRPAPPAGQPTPVGAVPEGSLVQLPPDSAQAFVRDMLDRSGGFRQLVDYFSRMNFQFIPERARAFLYAGQSASRPFTPSVLGFLPSFTTVRRSDPFHVAVTVGVHHEGSAIAGSVTVRHDPFVISDFSVHELTSDGEVQSVTVDTERLRALTVDELARQLGPVLTPDAVERGSEGHIAHGQLSLVVATLYRQLITDDFARPLYTEAELRAMLGQTSLIERFALANTRRTDPSGALMPLCCSTSSNGCCSTSCCIVPKVEVE